MADDAVAGAEGEPVPDPAGEPAETFTGNSRTGAFQVHLHNFDGPFDLLLQLISKHKMDVTEVALHQVTDDFIAHIRAMGKDWDLGQATEFLVVAATLLDLKAARLLPAAEVDDEEDLALLEARDLLFARLLQYRAYKEVAAFLAVQEAAASKRYPRSVALEERYAKAIPEVLLALSPQQFAELAARALSPKPVPTVSIDHIHSPRVSVREHALLLREALLKHGSATFRALCGDCQSTLEVVARFLGLLELYRDGVLHFEQVEALGELHVRWIGGAEAESAGAEIDEYGDEHGDDEHGDDEQPETPGEGA
ncbi:MAG: segregation/condensation protein [Actinomycetia bacterium]|nr:segregation/condensation protein [Actinomycetes bacterium]MDQ1652415.1 segregation and condensation protein [Cryptosporangiaceae bacterium]